MAVQKRNGTCFLTLVNPDGSCIVFSVGVRAEMLVMLVRWRTKNGLGLDSSIPHIEERGVTWGIIPPHSRKE